MGGRWHWEYGAAALDDATVGLDDVEVKPSP